MFDIWITEFVTSCSEYVLDRYSPDPKTRDRVGIEPARVCQKHQDRDVFLSVRYSHHVDFKRYKTGNHTYLRTLAHMSLQWYSTKSSRFPAVATQQSWRTSSSMKPLSQTFLVSRSQCSDFSIAELTIIYSILFRLNLLLFGHLRPVRVRILERMPHREIGHDGTFMAYPVHNKVQILGQALANCHKDSHHGRAGVKWVNRVVARRPVIRRSHIPRDVLLEVLERAREEPHRLWRAMFEHVLRELNRQNSGKEKYEG